MPVQSCLLCAQMLAEALLAVRAQNEPNFERTEATAERELHVAQIQNGAGIALLCA